MEKRINRKAMRSKVRKRIRAKVRGTAERPRVAVFRSARHIYVQAIDDRSGRTLAHASSRDAGVRTNEGVGGNLDTAKHVGSALAERLKAAGIAAAVFDRGGRIYHGRIKALADAAREAGVKI